MINQNLTLSQKILKLFSYIENNLEGTHERKAQNIDEALQAAEQSNIRTLKAIAKRCTVKALPVELKYMMV